ncbi:hypothetical protein BCR43DRAFT_444969 [Syncephalastrum racemosum]|uniref:Uncharacterized protein n=1 Tax=Syncephalastrum racemosum TaxID=13706 RepID=A0A1X2H4Q5_SYNRA|nr:hypothetical protein BCR43DRAFT_444969 [Syncephalastrum racemosum]
MRPLQQGNQSEENATQNKYALHEQNEDLPMDLGDLQDIFSFQFIRGRPIWSFILAILWSIGLPILLYHLLRPHIGQVLAMVVAACPPLAIVIARMVKDKQFDPLGLVAGISFLISGLVSISEPSEQVEAICESIVPLLVGVFCIVSLIPIRIGSFTLRPLVFQVVNQVMPRSEDAELEEQDRQRIANHHRTRKEKLDWAYTNLARFRTDMRIMTGAWGAMLIIGFIVKLIVVLTNVDIGSAETAGYIIFGVGSVLMAIFTWFYMNICKGHAIQNLAFWRENKEQEMNAGTTGLQNANWGMQTMNNAWGQVMG